MSTPASSSADGARIAYERIGSGPPVVIVHGGLGTSAGWRGVAEQLVDSLFAAVGKSLDSEELNQDVDGRRPVQYENSRGHCPWPELEPDRARG